MLYVEELIGPDTVDTMPEETIQAFQDHGEVAETLTQDIDEAHEVFERLAAVGVDYDDVSAVLEKEGVEKFSDSFSELLEGIKAKRGGSSLHERGRGPRRADLGARRDRLDRVGRSAVARLAGRAVPRARPLGCTRRRLRALRPARHGGSSLAPEVFRRSFGSQNFHVLDTTHPKAIRRLQDSIDVGRTFFVASSKSGSTLETRSHLEHFWELAGQNPEQFAVVTDPGSDLEALAQERAFHAVFHGEPAIGGRYSACRLSASWPRR